MNNNSQLVTLIRRRLMPRGRVLVASLPRCGSTYLFRSLADLPQGDSFPQDSDCSFVRDPGRLPDSKFLKTHGLAPTTVPDDVKVIFLFGDPIRAVVSTRRRRYNAAHCRNCGYRQERLPNLYAGDALGYEAIFDSWMNVTSYPVLALRYERLGDHEPTLSRFLNRNVKLLPRRERATDVPAALRIRLRRIYGNLEDKTNDAPDASVSCCLGSTEIGITGNRRRLLKQSSA